MTDEIAGLVKLKHGRGGGTALRDAGRGGGMQFTDFERAPAMNDPDVILRVDRDANGLAHDPVIGQRLGPQGIDLKARRHDTGGVNDSPFFEQGGPGGEQADDCDQTSTYEQIAFHVDRTSC